MSGQKETTWNSCGEAAVAPSDVDKVESVVAHLEDELTQDLSIADRFLNDIDHYTSFSLDRERRIFREFSNVRQELLEATAVCTRIADLSAVVSEDLTKSGSADDEVETLDEADQLSDIALQDPDAQLGRLPFEVGCRLLQRLAAEQFHPDVVTLQKALEKYRKIRERAMEGG